MRTLRASIGLLLLLRGISWCAEPFPEIEAENLLGKKVALPEVLKGHPTVIVIGFTRASQSQTKAWNARLEPELAPYSLAVLEEAPRLVRGMAISSIKGGVPQNRRDRFLLVFHGEKQLKDAVGFERSDDAYVIVTDRNGLIQSHFHGPFSESLLEQLKAQVTNLQKAP